mmetsp:Transcript_9755/g.8753  ORF Transcript_9755/g.8753 Transcript_9755/m.8753 type:complete len:353 (-) Transcript_9755:566-1624(-)
MAMQERKDQEELEVFSVELEVISGHGLAAKDGAISGGKSDPYVKISIGDRENKTKVVKNNLNPVWNAKFSYKFFENPKQIRFEVLDEDLTSDDKLGFAEFNLNEYFNSKQKKPFNGHIKLNNKNSKKAKGTIKIKVNAIKFLPFSLQKVAQQQKETIYKQNQEINNLSQQNKSIQKENASLKSASAQPQQQQQQQPGSSSSSSSAQQFLPQIPTKRSKEEIKGFLTSMIIKILSIWQIILKKVIYGFPFIGYYADLFILFFGSILRLEVGYNVFRGATSSKRPPTKLLKLYEYEACPFCRKVRETLCVLDLDAIIYPCPRETFKSYGFIKDSRYRKEAKKIRRKSTISIINR